jgi:hypothetical protein
MRTLAIATLSTAALLSGCATTMDDLQRGIAAANAPAHESAATAVVTPPEVISYEAFRERNASTCDASKKSMLAANYSGVLNSFVNVSFRDAVSGRWYSVQTVKSWRFPVPQDAIDAQSADLAPLMSAMGARMAEWNRTEPIELEVVADSSSSVEYLASLLRRSTAGVKVTTKVSPGSAGYSGIELHLLSQSFVREVGKAK